MHAIRVKYLAICGAMLIYANLAGAQQSALIQARAFAPGQAVRVDVNVADIRILRDPEDHQLRLVIQPKRAISHAEMQSWIREFDINGNQATIRLHMPKQGRDSGTVELYVPSLTALNVEIGVGDVTIDGINGDKDVSMHVGDLKIGALNRATYGIVKVSTGIGDLKDDVFSGRESGWLGKSGEFVGSGKYHIRTHVGIGDIRLLAGPIGGTD